MQPKRLEITLHRGYAVLKEIDRENGRLLGFQTRDAISEIYIKESATPEVRVSVKVESDSSLTVREGGE